MAGTTQYLLDCSCGKRVDVTVAQAGLSVRCQCGAELTVPSVREIKKLERSTAPDAPRAAQQSHWGLRQSLVSFGAFIVLGAVIALIVAYWLRPVNPSRRIAADLIDSLHPAQQLDYWQTIRDRGLVPVPNQEMKDYADAMERNQRWMGVIVGVGVVGVGFAAWSFLLPTPGKRKR